MFQQDQLGWVFYVSLVLLATFVVLGIGWPAQLALAADTALQFTTDHFGWLYLFVTTGFLIFCIGVGMSDYGKIRLGADGEMPEFTYGAWLGMIFSAGMGVGLVFWGIAEPMTHYLSPPLGQAPAESA